MSTQYPFSAIVGADDLSLALILTTISPDVGGVLLRGEKGTAKSTIVRGLVGVLPDLTALTGCRFSCDPVKPDDSCPDGPHSPDADTTRRPAKLVELPVGATEDRVTGSLDLSQALTAGRAAFQPGLLAEAHRGLLYVDEVNLLSDHLVDLLLDAAAMGRNSVEREGLSASHAAQLVLVGTMNPEEGELRPQLLDRFGLTVEVMASRDPQVRTEVVRRRLRFDADPVAFTNEYADAQQKLSDRIIAATERVHDVVLSDEALHKIAVVCAGFDVDGMRADIVTARTARAHAAWCGRDHVTREDIRVAATFALPHRRRRNPFDAPGLDEDLLDELLGSDDDHDGPDPDDSGPDDGDDGSDDPAQDHDGPNDQPSSGPEDDTGTSGGDGSSSSRDTGSPQNTSDQPATNHQQDDGHQQPTPSTPDGTSGEGNEDGDGESGAATAGVAAIHQPYRARSLTVKGTGKGESGRRSPAYTARGRVVRPLPSGSAKASIHLPATIVAAAPHQQTRGRTRGPLKLATHDMRYAQRVGRESNLVLFVVDASGSMGARQRMSEVKTAIMSLLVDAYERRDRIGMITFRGHDASLVLHPTSSVEAAARCLTDLPHGGRTPLAEALNLAAKVVEIEKVREPNRRPLVVLITDGRATAGPGAIDRAQAIGDAWSATGIDSVVIDCESGKFKLGLAIDLALRMGADYLPLQNVSADHVIQAVTSRQTTRTSPGRAA